MSLDTLSAWMTLFAGPVRQVQADDLSADVYGEGDSAYLVLERALGTSPRSSDQYVLHPLQGGNALFQQLRFLAECDFDLRKAVQRLESAIYIEEAMNDVARFETVEVARYRIQEN